MRRVRASEGLFLQSLKRYAIKEPEVVRFVCSLVSICYVMRKSNLTFCISIVYL